MDRFIKALEQYIAVFGIECAFENIVNDINTENAEGNEINSIEDLAETMEVQISYFADYAEPKED